MLGRSFLATCAFPQSFAREVPPPFDTGAAFGSPAEDESRTPCACPVRWQLPPVLELTPSWGGASR